jgi:hypothetical protein
MISYSKGIKDQRAFHQCLNNILFKINHTIACCGENDLKTKISHVDKRRPLQPVTIAPQSVKQFGAELKKQNELANGT